MLRQRINFGLLVCFSISLFVGQGLSETRGSGRTRDRYGRGRIRNTNREQKEQTLERHILELQQLKKEMDLGESVKGIKSEKELMKQILRTTEKQWKAIEAKVNKVRELRNLANISIKVKYYGGGYGYGSGMIGNREGTVWKRYSAGGNISHSQTYSFYRWSRPSKHRGFENLNEGEKICEELFRLLEDNNSESEQIRQKMEALRKFRQEAKKELAIAQKELRQLVTTNQEAALVMMQILD